MQHKIEFPGKTLTIEGTSKYAENVKFESLAHLALALDHLFVEGETPFCLDVGANIGLTALLMDHSLKGATVWAFEPHPLTYSQMCDNLEANKSGRNSFETFNLGLGKENTELLFRDIDEFNTGNSILLENSLAARVQKSNRVQVKRLDDFADLPAQIDLMKIDVEGFELDVLEGASGVLNRTKAVLIEFNHWCLSSLAHVLPIDALHQICGSFEAVFVYDLRTKKYVRLVTDADRWGFLHKNMVNFNVNDLLCTNDPSVIDAFLPEGAKKAAPPAKSGAQNPTIGKRLVDRILGN